jgi:hypothetical protein
LFDEGRDLETAMHKGRVKRELREREGRRDDISQLQLRTVNPERQLGVT